MKKYFLNILKKFQLCYLMTRKKIELEWDNLIKRKIKEIQSLMTNDTNIEGRTGKKN